MVLPTDPWVRSKGRVSRCPPGSQPPSLQLAVPYFMPATTRERRHLPKEQVVIHQLPRSSQGTQGLASNLLPCRIQNIPLTLSYTCWCHAGHLNRKPQRSTQLLSLPFHAPPRPLLLIKLHWTLFPPAKPSAFCKRRPFANTRTGMLSKLSLPAPAPFLLRVSSLRHIHTLLMHSGRHPPSPKPRSPRMPSATLFRARPHSHLTAYATHTSLDVHQA